MKERPILFNGEMVRAILKGRKTQTRRIIKPQPIQPAEGAYFDKYNKGPQWNWWSHDNKQFLSQIIHCPFGKVGDRLWVRENFYIDHYDYLTGPFPKKRPADINDDMFFYEADGPYKTQFEQFEPQGFRARPSIHMPRWASRINLEITNIRVEQIQDGGDREFWGEETWKQNPWVWVIEFKKI